MARKSDRKALGRGLSALLGDQGTQSAMQAPPTGTRRVSIDLIDANPHQPRKTFRQEDLQELAASLKRHGIVQPIVLRPSPLSAGRFQIVAGERRWRAAQLAELHDLPAVVREIDDRQLLELAIIENIQRVDLDPVEEAQGFRQLIDTFGYTQAELADVIGKSRSHLANTMRLLTLPDQVLVLVQEGKLSAGHARALINATDPVGLAQQAVRQDLTVRQVEKLAKTAQQHDGPRSQASRATRDADTAALEGDISAAIKMRVSIMHGSNGGGEVKIRYKDLDDLDRLCQKLTD